MSIEYCLLPPQRFTLRTSPTDSYMFWLFWWDSCWPAWQTCLPHQLSKPCHLWKNIHSSALFLRYWGFPKRRRGGSVLFRLNFSPPPSGCSLFSALPQHNHSWQITWCGFIGYKTMSKNVKMKITLNTRLLKNTNRNINRGRIRQECKKLQTYKKILHSYLKNLAWWYQQLQIIRE